MAVLATIFGLFSALGPIFDSAPGLRMVWRWALERQMEVTILPRLWREGRANNGPAAKAELVKRYKRWFSQNDLRRALKVEGSQKTLADLPFDSFLRVA